MGKPSALPSDTWSESFWHSQPSKKLFGHRTSSCLPESADVVIVGSGMTAAGAAWRLLRGPAVSSDQTDGRPLSVVMLEAREACWGATGRNGGHCFPIPYDFPEDPDIGHFEIANLKAIESLIRENGIDCEYHAQSSVRAIYSTADLEDAKRAMAALEKRDANLAAHVQLVTDPAVLSQLRAPSALAATTCNIAARFWPYKFVAGLLEELIFNDNTGRQQTPLNLQVNTAVTSISASKDPHRSHKRKPDRWKLHTSRGTIEAPQVILATNGHLSALLPDFSNLIVPCRGQAAALIPPLEAIGKKRIKHNHIFAGEGFYDYLVQLSQREGEKLIFGGGDEKAGLGCTDDSIIDPATADYLKRRLYDHLDLGNSVDSSGAELERSHQWSGIMGYSRDGLPWVGPVPSYSGLFIAAGYTGNGMPNAFLCGQAVATMIKSERQGEDHAAVRQSAVHDPDILLPQAYLTSQERIDGALALEAAKW